VVRGHIFKIPSIVVDTHVKRVSNRLGLTKNSDPVKIEYELMEILPETYWISYNQQAISHGRQICTARNPRCGKCELSDICFFDREK
jgi:endonuclease-3